MARIWSSKGNKPVTGTDPNTFYGDGSDCTGVSGDTNRVLTITTPTIASSERIYVGAQRLDENDYSITFNNTSIVITFNIAIYDNQKIAVDYFL